LCTHHFSRTKPVYFTYTVTLRCLGITAFIRAWRLLNNMAAARSVHWAFWNLSVFETWAFLKPEL
jgi:hypothetical protein